jgi:uncharacterized protein YceK
MARGVLLIALAAVMVPCLSGCGTFCNTVWWIPEEGGMRVYGGVRAELENFQQAPVAFTLDLPLSLVGDTLTLPFVLVNQFGKASEPAESLQAVKEESQNWLEGTKASELPADSSSSPSPPPVPSRITPPGSLLIDRPEGANQTPNRLP